MRLLALIAIKKNGPFIVREFFLFFVIFSFVLLVNLPVISFDMMYPEQPLLYTANQSLHSLYDLLQVYLHPKMFHISILFFRPSGHFLMYQLLAPLLGWHNTKAFIIVNLTFLAFAGYVFLKLYNLLFPNFKAGGYLALSVYLMHPALMLSRLIILHFEFAYIFFTLLSLYCFVLFCKKNLENFYLLACSLFFYIVAVTFKEPALILGPVLFCYLCLSQYQGQGLRFFIGGLLKDKKIREILLLLIVLSLSLALYLSLQWPLLKHPLRTEVKAAVIFAALHKLIATTWGLKSTMFTPPVWRNVLFPAVARFILWALGAVTLWSTVLIIKNKEPLQKPLGFLYLACFLFFILPVCWGWGLPWHLSLSLLFLSMLMGLSGEYLFRKLTKYKNGSEALCFLAALGVGLTAIQVNQTNINYYLAEQGFPLAVERNAVLHPPVLKAKLDAQTVLVVEDSSIHDAYLLGASIYPFYFSFKLNSLNLDANEQQYEQAKKSLFLRQQPVYNGTLFRWAYLMPELQEEVYPFQVEKMEEVPDAIIYNWLQHQNNIVCLGYDKQANWHDRSVLFKEKLLLEKVRRGLVVNSYDALPATVFIGTVMNKLVLPVPEPQLCQLSCDQDKQCTGFTYVNLEKRGNALTECLFYKSVSENNKAFCAACVGFVKKSLNKGSL